MPRALRFRSIIAILVVITTMSGCLREPRRLTVDEVGLVVHYVEEVAHGEDPSPYELLRADASEGLLAVADWAMGHVVGDRPVIHPKHLAARRERWPLVRQGLRRRVVVIDDEGLLRLHPMAGGDDPRLYQDLLKQENLDRATVASILLRRGQVTAGSPRGRELLARLATARIARARAVGGTTWNASSASKFPDAATTSTSTPVPSTGSDP